MGEPNLDLTNLELADPVFRNVKFYVSGDVQNEVSIQNSDH